MKLRHDEYALIKMGPMMFNRKRKTSYTQSNAVKTSIMILVTRSPFIG